MPQIVIYLLTVVVIGLCMMGFALGYILRGRCIRGTCSTEGVIGPDGEIMTCDTCPRRARGECEGEHDHEHEHEHHAA